MTTATTQQLLTKLRLEIPILGAPMAGAGDATMAAAVARAGALASLPCAAWSLERARHEMTALREALGDDRPFNVNFFCHAPPEDVAADRADRWATRLATLRSAYGLGDDDELTGWSDAGPKRGAFDDAASLLCRRPALVSSALCDVGNRCRLVEELRPGAVSFHFGLPEPALLGRVKSTGAVVLASATTVREATWLEANGADVIIAQGSEAGGHRSNFLGPKDPSDVASQIGTFALVPMVVDAVSVPVVAAGGISDGRGVLAALALGADAVQVGSAYLRATESRIPAYHKAALDAAESDSTTLTNVFSGRPARSVVNEAVRTLGPINFDAPPFPTAPPYLTAIKKAADAKGRLGEVSSLWSGQAATLAPPTSDQRSVTDITRAMWADSRSVLEQLHARAAPGRSPNEDGDV